MARAAPTPSLFQPGSLRQVTFFAPELFVSLGMPQHTALIATTISGFANHLAVYVSIWAADEFGRRFLFLEGGIQVGSPDFDALPQASIRIIAALGAWVSPTVPSSDTSSTKAIGNSSLGALHHDQHIDVICMAKS